MSAQDLLAACVHHSDARPHDRADLLVASLRLADRPSTRIYGAIHSAVLGQWGLVRRSLQRYWCSPGGYLDSCYALAWEAILVEQTELPCECYQAHRRAYEFGRLREVARAAAFASQVNAFAILVRFGSRAQILAEAGVLASVPPIREVAARTLHLIRHRNDRASIGPNQLAVIRSLRDSTQGLAQEIVDATSR